MPVVSVSVDISAAPETVARHVGAFDLIADVHPQIASCDAEGEGVGATRVLWLADGQEIHERIVEVFDGGYVYEGTRPSINFQSWRGRVEMVAVGGGTRVRWTIDFEPREGVDPEAVAAQQRGIFEEGLDAAKRQLAGLD